MSEEWRLKCSVQLHCEVSFVNQITLDQSVEVVLGAVVSDENLQWAQIVTVFWTLAILLEFV